MVTALEKVEAERDAVKATIEFIEQQVIDNLTTPMTIHAVNKFISLAEKAEETVMEIHTRIVQLKPTDILIHTNEYQGIMRMVTGAFAALQGIKAGLNPVGSTSSTSSSAAGSGTSSDIRLPRFNIPKFHGNLLDWVQFRDLFQTVIHNNKQLSNAQKLAHLKSFLEDEPARLIKTLTLTDANYSIAWDLLVLRYHNERELLFAVFRKFFNQPSVNPNSSESIRKIIDVTTECVQQLQVLAITKDAGLDAVLLYSVSIKLDQTSKELWEQTLNTTQIPTLKSLFDFLEARARSLVSTGHKQPQKPKEDHPKRTAHVHHATDNHSKCKVCTTQSHPIYKCSTFMEKTPKERHELVKKLSLCFNCLHHTHSLSKCSSSSRCRTCNGKHHTLIHLQSNQNQSSDTSSTSTTQVESGSALSFHTNNYSTESEQSILATAIVRVKDGNGAYQLCRAFLDAGSTASFITTSCAQRLNLAKRRSNVEVVGLSSSHLGHANGSTSFTFKPHFESPMSFAVQALVLPRITGKLPLENFNPDPWSHLHNLLFADPQYQIPAPVDILLGSDIFWSLLLDGKRQGPPNTPIAVNSSLGWLVGGKTSSAPRKVLVHYADTSLDVAVQKFWELESIANQSTLTKEEQAAESHFVSTCTRDATGRFSVKIPWKTNAAPLGDSRAIAVRRLIQLEKRLPNNESHLASYREFMREYLSLGHMELIPRNEIFITEHPIYYIPHHFVLKMDSTTTQFRVVFNASSLTTNGTSINEQMLVGPTIQDSLADIVMRFRCNAVAFTADIGKMYRQILLTKEDIDRHRIIWRNSPQEEMQEYRLLTVAYGTASAPFLATRVLQQLAEDEKMDLPLAYIVAVRDFYMDDLMSGADSVEEAIEIKNQLLEMMKRGQLELRKWASNSKEFLLSLPEKLRESKPSALTSTTTSPPTTRMEGIGEPLESGCVPLSNLNGEDFSVKCLGIYWNTTQDIFQFLVHLPPPTLTITKRTILSEMSRLYDPLGWLSPVVIAAKIFMQSLWKLDVSWDTQLSEVHQSYWKSYKDSLQDIKSISIHRCVLLPKYNKLVLAGFSDASERAYSAVAYLCAFYDDRQPMISLLCSKTRVAPTRQISLPRLELCGAVLLSQLLVSVQKGLRRQLDDVSAWTDSTVVLAWIRSSSSTLKTFVGNRVSEIQSNLSQEHWFHVPGVLNPADCASRGISPDDLRRHDLWWRGPSFLAQNCASCEDAPVSSEDVLKIDAEQKKQVLVATASLHPDFRDVLLAKFSCIKKIIRIVAYVRRFITLRFFPTTEITGNLSSRELQDSMLSIIRRVQEVTFPEDLANLNKGHELHSKSKILSLSPFVDSTGVLRVGGRLRHSSICASRRNPILLPRHHRFVDLIILAKHLEYFHAGPQLLQSLLQQQFWIIRGRDAIRFSNKRCIVCRKQSARTMQTLMGDLPATRVNPGRPFLTTGVDYAGPFLLKSDAPRSKSRIKAYLCILVCFVTRAVHLEIVSSLSTDAFIAALRRFVARRNKPNTIYSDCGTNFVGAAREIKETTKYLMSHDHNKKIATELSNQSIDWRFNPPGAPHFGGLWEAGVKSVKYHLCRVMGTTTLNFEEMTTLMTQIEACLNSRPLTPISTSPDDLEALTPGHFLTGGPLGTVPQVDLREINVGRLDRWQLLQRKTQEFWGRWSSEYVSRLQQRPKWMKERDEISVNDMVIIKDERLPPQKWKLGRVTKVHPGLDGITRVVTLRTAEGELKRPLAKLCLLPIEESHESST